MELNNIDVNVENNSQSDHAVVIKDDTYCIDQHQE